MRAQYKEAFVVVRCSFAGRTYSRCVYIWVDKDFAIARGLHQGYPKKLGSIHQTRPHPYGPAAPRSAPGGVFGATLAAGDRRLAEARITLREESATNGFVNAHPMAHHRVLPGIDDAGTSDAFDELIASGVERASRPGRRCRADVDPSTSSTRRPRSWTGCGRRRSSAATTGRSGWSGTAADPWPAGQPRRAGMRRSTEYCR